MADFDPNKLAEDVRNKLDTGIILELMGHLSGGEVKDNFFSVLVVYKGDINALKEVGFQPGVASQGVVTGKISFDDVVSLASLDSVEQVDLSYPVYEELDGSVPAIQADQVHNMDPSRTGAGVIVGIIDSGIDFMHKSFRKSDGKTRILRIWDQTLTAQAGESAPTEIAGAGGVEYSADDIDFTIDTTDGRTPTVAGVNVRHRDSKSNGDPNGHGTHVAGIAAGDGSQAGNCHGADTYVGVAPDADIILVKANTTAGIADAVTYIFAVADDTPCVINISLGSDFGVSGIGAHDGTRPDEVRMDGELNGSTGRAVVKSAGNSANKGRHASANINSNGSASWTFNVPAGDTDTNSIGIWYSGAARLDFTLTDRNGNSQGPISPGNSPSPAFPDGTVTPINSRLNRPPAQDVNGGPRNMHNIAIRMNPPESSNILDGDWTITLQETSGNDTTAHCWVGDSGDKVAKFVETDRAEGTTLTMPGTGANTITVAAYDHSSGDLADFSSRGPTIDGRQKPDITAPGVAIAAPKNLKRGGICSDCCYSFYTDKQGTSMAAPHVTGTVALMLQKNPEISFRLIKRFLNDGAATPSGVNESDLPTPEWGSGLLNASDSVGWTISPPGGGGGGGGLVAPVFETPIFSMSRLFDWPVPEFRKTLHLLHKRLIQSDSGKTLSALISLHFDQVFRLITTNRKVATTWQRNFGPKLVQYLLRNANYADITLPIKLEDRDTSTGMEKFFKILYRFGNASLRKDIERYSPFIKVIWGKKLNSLKIN